MHPEFILSKELKEFIDFLKENLKKPNEIKLNHNKVIITIGEDTITALPPSKLYSVTIPNGIFVFTENELIENFEYTL